MFYQKIEQQVEYLFKKAGPQVPLVTPKATFAFSHHDCIHLSVFCGCKRRMAPKNSLEIILNDIMHLK